MSNYFIPDPIQPSPLVWISPSSLARSPMVMLRRLSTDQNEEKIERSLTMNFPARNSRRFDPLCLACFPNGSNCPVSCLSLKWLKNQMMEKSNGLEMIKNLEIFMIHCLGSHHVFSSENHWFIFCTPPPSTLPLLVVGRSHMMFFCTNAC